MDSTLNGNMVQKSVPMSDHDSRRKKIVVLENGLFSTYTMREALMLRLRDEGHDVYVITHTNQFVELVRKWRINVIDVGSSNQNPFQVLAYITRLFRVIRNIKPDVCLTFSIRPAIWGNIITRILHIPTITNITGTGPLFVSDSFVYKIARTLYKIVLQKTKKVFFQNEDDMNLFIKRGYIRPGVAERIPGSGVDTNKFKPLNVQRDPSVFIFLFIGRLIKDKGIYEYIEAARLIKKEYPNVVFQVIGPLWTQNLKANIITAEELKEWIREGIVDYLGEKMDVREFIAMSDCIVLPSYREGTANVLLEASSMEHPCITTNVTGCKEVIVDGETGLLCRVKDSTDLMLKMKAMMALTPLDRDEMGRKGRVKIINEFEKNIVVKAYLKAIDDVVYPLTVVRQKTSSR